MICLLVMTDGRRDCIEQAIASAEEHLLGTITHRVIHDDSADDGYNRWLRNRFGAYGVIRHPAGRQGFGGAIANAWRYVRTLPCRFVFHLEDDFIFGRTVDLHAMASVLDRHPHLAQLALRRQPWNDQERAAGGIVECHPSDYREQTDGTWSWLEHRRFFTTNPSLYRLSLCSLGWPDGSYSEGRFGLALAADPSVRFGFWGARDSGEWVRHIGGERVGTGY